MGYYTSYSLEARSKKFLPDDLKAITEKLKELHVLDYALDDRWTEIKSLELYDDIFFDGADCVKWYEHDRDMKELSLAFPDVIFCLHGQGEDPGDIWDDYWQNGTNEYCPVEIVYPKPTRIAWEF